MAKTLEQINQECYIQRYLAGGTPQAPLWAPPPSAQTLRRDEVERWMRELVDSPDLEDAEELLDGLPLPGFTAPARRKEGKPPAAQFKLPREAPAGQGSGLWKSISNILFYAALVAIVLGASILGSKNNGGSALLGFRYFEVLSSSMQSMIPKGSLVFTLKVPSEEIRTGDVITFLRSDEKNITHQVIAVVPDFDGRGTLGFQTKGTDSPDPDPDIVAAPTVMGVVKWHVKDLGFTLSYISEHIKYVFLGFILVILLSIALRMFLGERAIEGVQRPEEGRGHKLTGRKKSHPEERNEPLCKRQAKAAKAKKLPQS